MLVGIVGAGPAGCALACFLAERGVKSILFDNEKRPSLLVGESLVPAVVPYLQRLGIEDDVAAISAKKQGAALRHSSGLRVNFNFRRFTKTIPNYSYNIPRPEFDELMCDRARAMGVRFVRGQAKVEKSIDPNRELVLSQSTLDAAGLSSQPDFLVDASGRHRLFSRTLSLKADKGGRDDVSYFAHYEHFKGDALVQGQVVLSIIDSGWAWQIPLQDKLSVGVVLDRKTASHYGKTPEERLENIIDADMMLRPSGNGRRRCSDVMTYSNYQLISQQGFGRDWALLGDAFGFVDPMLSPGLFMALESAATLDQCLFAKNAMSKSINARMKSLQMYSDKVNKWHRSWSEVIEYFYDGRLLGLFEAGQNVVKNASRWSPTRFMEWHIRRVVSSMVSGAETCSAYNRKALYHSCRHLLSDDIDINRYKIQSHGKYEKHKQSAVSLD